MNSDQFSYSEPPRQTAFPIASPGYPLIFAAAFTTAVFALLGLTCLALTGLAITFFICWFFRDPDRLTPRGEGIVVSPADGRIVALGQTDGSPFFDGICTKISIFMSVFNVHVNRIPYNGTVTEVIYHPGKFFNASLDKSSKENEHNAVFIETPDGKKICTVQVAGLIARRIICNIQKGDNVIRGQRFGMICFGSRLDVYLPPNFRIEVSVGDNVKAGTTILGGLP
ncbi:MAG: phosphatidylserine decarboxylase [Desulfobacteraceae bacterium IS3]|nr:MAG: phosphatidylserine decarboxylase [Desulfobacteraceae bacterium IS3]